MIISRLLQFIDYKGLNKSKFYKETGLSNGFLDKVRDVGSSKLEDILNKYPEINSDWLLTGNGTMLKYDVPVAARADDSSGIPLIPLEAMAGLAKGDISVMELNCERYVIPMFQSADFLIPVRGSSMVPKYNSGDVVACKRLPLTDLFFQWNKVYVLDTDQGALVKRVTKSEEPDCIRIVSENPSYEPFDLKLSSIHALSIVVGVVRLE